jgi:hypothetical protein
MVDLDVLAGFVGVAAILAFTPGPDVLYAWVFISSGRDHEKECDSTRVRITWVRDGFRDWSPLSPGRRSAVADLRHDDRHPTKTVTHPDNIAVPKR